MNKIVQDLREKIEKLLIEKMEEREEKLVSIIFEWDHDYTKINVYFESEWNDYSNPYGDADIVLEYTYFAQLIDDIANGKIEDIDLEGLDTLEFKEFGNRMIFLDDSKDNLQRKVLQMSKNTLVELTKEICERKKLPLNENLLSFKVNAINSGSHATLTRFYSEYSKDTLYKTEVKSIERGEKTDCYITLNDDEIIFFRTTAYSYEEKYWEAVIMSKDEVVSINFDKIKSFNLESKFGDLSFRLNVEELGELVLEIEEEIDNTKSEEEMRNVFVEALRKRDNIEEKDPIIKVSRRQKKIINEEEITENDKVLVKMARTEEIIKETLSYTSLVEKNLNSEEPRNWNVYDNIDAEDTSFAILFFKDNNKDYVLTRKGSLFEVKIKEDKIILENEKVITPAGEVDTWCYAGASHAYYDEGVLYILDTDKVITIYNMKDGKTSSGIDRFTDELISGITVKNKYMLICSNGGAELYFVNGETVEQIELISVGNTAKENAWAKNSVINGEYLYITAGEMGLITYKLDGKNKPQLIDVLAIEYENPFLDEIVILDNNLIIKLDGNYCIVNIDNAEKPRLENSFFGGSNDKIGSLFLDEKAFFFDGNIPMMWSYSGNNKNEAINCEYIDPKDGVVFHYPKEFVLIEDGLILSTDKKFIFMKREKAEKIDNSQMDDYFSKIDDIYNIIVKDVEDYLKSNDKVEIEIVNLEIKEEYIKLIISESDFLIKVIGYELNEIIDKDIEWKDFGIEKKEREYPYDIFFANEFKMSTTKMARLIFEKIAKEKKDTWGKELKFINTGYNKRDDRYVKQILEIN